MATRYPSWYFADEWALIAKTLDPWSRVFGAHNGHLAIEAHLAYRLQVELFGLGGHAVLWGALVGSVVAFQVAVALVLRRLGVHSVLALVLATVVTYFGPGAENVVWQFQHNLTLALAASFAAAYVALADDKQRRGAFTIGGFLIAAFLFDSGVALLGAIYVGALVVATWPRRLAAFALIPAVIAHSLWLVVGESTKHLDVGLSKMWDFGTELLLRAASGLVGGGEAESRLTGGTPSPVIPIDVTVLGVLVLVTAGVLAVIGLRKGWLDRRNLVPIVAGVVAALVTVAILARTRAWITDPNQPGLRYLQWVAVFLLLGFAPLVGSVVRLGDARTRRMMTALAVVAGVAVFVINLEQLRPVQRYFEHTSLQLRTKVGEVIDVLETGCGDGEQIVRRAQVAPELTVLGEGDLRVSFVEDLLDRGALPRELRVAATAEVRERVCQPTSALRG